MKKSLIIVMVMIAALFAACSSGGSGDDGFMPNPDPSPDADFTVRVAAKSSSHPWFGQGNSEAFVIDGVQGKELTLIRGTTYTFDVQTSGHPFYISTSDTGVGAGEVTNGVTNSRTQSRILTFTPNETHPDLLYYQCAIHPKMGYRINIVDPS